MKRTYILVVFLIASTGVLVAQNNNSGNTSENRHGHNSSFRGCISGSEGGYMLRSGGTTYELVGNQELVSKLVGKEVKISGLEGTGTDVSTGMSGNTGEATTNPSAGTAPTIRVSSATILSDHCTGGK
jgi:hypothetical protein